MNRFFSRGSITLLMMLVTAPAQADDAALEAKARALYRSATAHFEAGRYVEAQADFSAGYELSRKPGFLWNMAESARLAGRGDRSLELYRQYVSAAEPSAQRTEAQSRIRELEARRTPVDAAAAKVAAPSPPLPSPRAGEDVALANRHTGPSNNVAVFAPLPNGNEPRNEGAKPITTKWWFWAATAGVATVAIATTAIVVNSGSSQASPSIPTGNTVVSWR